MNFDQTPLEEIEDFITAKWSETPVCFENMQFDEPKATATSLAPPWILIEIEENLSEQRSFGSGDPATDRWTVDGNLYAHIMVPVGTRARIASSIAHRFTLMFRGIQLPSSLKFGDCRISAGAATDKVRGPWFHKTATVYWDRG